MAATDDFVNSKTRDDPVTSAAAVTPHDTNELSHVSRALWVGVAGDVKVTMMDNQTITFTNVTVGWHPLRVRLVFSTGTTASGIVAAW